MLGRRRHGPAPTTKMFLELIMHDSDLAHVDLDFFCVAKAVAQQYDMSVDEFLQCPTYMHESPQQGEGPLMQMELRVTKEMVALLRARSLRMQIDKVQLRINEIEEKQLKPCEALRQELMQAWGEKLPRGRPAGSRLRCRH